MESEINIVIGNTAETDLDLFFGPLKPEDQFHKMDDATTWADILVKFGIFKSKNEARKNTGANQILPGWHDVTRGKLRIRFCVLKIAGEEHEPSDREPVS